MRGKGVTMNDHEMSQEEAFEMLCGESDISDADGDAILRAFGLADDAANDGMADD